MNQPASSSPCITVVLRLYFQVDSDVRCETSVVSDVEEAILSYRRARKAHRRVNRAIGGEFSIDGGSTFHRC